MGIMMEAIPTSIHLKCSRIHNGSDMHDYNHGNWICAVELHVCLYHGNHDNHCALNLHHEWACYRKTMALFSGNSEG